MKNKFQFRMLLILFVQVGTAYGQNVDSRADEREKFGTDTHLSFILKLVDTDFNYGKSNRELANYKKPVSSLQAGLSFQGGITKRLSLVSEVYFMMKGGKLKSGNPMTESSSTLRLYSVEMPGLARVHFNRFHINAGPSVAYNFTGRQKIGETRQHVSFQEQVGGFSAGKVACSLAVAIDSQSKEKL